jgi:hypothetical protein
MKNNNNNSSRSRWTRRLVLVSAAVAVTFATSTATGYAATIESDAVVYSSSTQLDKDHEVGTLKRGDTFVDDCTVFVADADGDRDDPFMVRGTGIPADGGPALPGYMLIGPLTVDPPSNECDETKPPIDRLFDQLFR